MDRRRMGVWGLALGIALAGGGCESAEQKCEAARDGAHGAWGPVADEALEAMRASTNAREAAIREVTRTAMDLGNLRSGAVEEALGTGNDGFVGVEVSIGAVVGAMLAADELPEAEAAEALAAAVTEEMGGRYQVLMTAPFEGEEAAAQLAEAGDRCSTRLQLLVREQPEAVRARVLETFTAMSTGEGDPPAGVSFEALQEQWGGYVAAAGRARRAQARLDAIIAAREAIREESSGAKAAVDAVEGGDEAGIAEARAASTTAYEACTAAGM